MTSVSHQGFLGWGGGLGGGVCILPMVVWYGTRGAREQTDQKWGGGVGFQKTALEKKTKITIGPLYRTMCCNEKYNIIFTLYHREVKNNSVAEITL